MTSTCENPAGVSPLRWFHIVLLAALLVLSGYIHHDRINRESLTLDEYWALYLATGRGDQLFQIPYYTLVTSPPNVGYENAPPWWHIWTGLDSTTHPPLYHLVLRAWVDLFGEGDLATRNLSWLFALAAIPLLFDAVRRTAGPWRGLLAAAFMALAPAGSDFSQEVRPYTMLLFLGCALCDVLIAIGQTGPSILKLALVALATAALPLTHYFSAGAILGAGIFASICFRGCLRKQTIASILAGLLLAALLWGPVFWKTRHLYDSYHEFWKETGSGLGLSIRAIARIPIRLLLDPSQPWPWFTAFPLALLVFCIPILRFRKSRDLILWWLWAVCSIAVVVAVDFIHHTTMVGVLRYVYLASPAVYAILAMAIPGRLGTLTATILLICSAVYGFSRMQTGPEPVEDWKTMAHLMDRMVGPHDLVAIIGYYPNEPAFDYFVISHYIGPWKRPVIFLMGPPNQQVKAELAQTPRVWMLGHATSETRRLLPGWTVGASRGVGKRNFVWLLRPPQ
jgi:hypothetical protein